MDVQAREVAWYRRHGKYAERIKRTRLAGEFVIGDWSWERSHPDKPERVEMKMARAGVYRGPKPRECNTCHGVKPPSEFYALKNGRRTGDCKECRKARSMKWQREHPKRLRLVS